MPTAITILAPVQTLSFIGTASWLNIALPAIFGGVSADVSNKFGFTVDSNASSFRYSQAGIRWAKRANSPGEVSNVPSADKKSSIPLYAGMLAMFVRGVACRVPQ